MVVGSTCQLLHPTHKCRNVLQCTHKFTYIHMPHKKYKGRRGEGERRKEGREGEGEKGRALAAKPDYMSLISGPTWYKRKLTPID